MVFYRPAPFCSVAQVLHRGWPIWWQISGWLSKGLSFFIRWRFVWWWMGAGNGRMWASAPTGVTGTRRGRHTGPPLQVRTGSRANCQGSALIPPRRGRRPRRPASTTKAAPAERGGQGYPGFPRANVFPKGTAFNEAETREGQPSPAGGRRYALARTDPP